MVEAGRRLPVPHMPATSLRRIACADDDGSERHRRFRVLLLRRAYRLVEWLPPEAVLNIRRIDEDPMGRFVRLTLHSGTQLLDAGDRITVRGVADDVAVDELVACVVRRGWRSVKVDGDEEFREAVARELLRAGVEVVDCPLDAEEVAAIRGELVDLAGVEAKVRVAEPRPLRL